MNSAKPLNPKNDFWVFIGMIFMLLIPSILTLLSVEERSPVVFPTNPTPYGYTWSLLLFLVPALTLLGWLHYNSDLVFPRKAFYWTCGLIIPLGFILDLFFGTIFFTFPNREATLGIWTPAFDLPSMQWIPNQLPIEEFGFYTFGITCVLLLYIWASEYWMGAYDPIDFVADPNHPKLKISFHWKCLIIGVSLIIAAWLIKKYGPHPYHKGFPGYFTFMVCASVIPCTFLYDTVASYINWRAVSTTYFFILLVSLLWEATLGYPFQWWGYKYDQMIGITIHAWYDLPLEETILWGAVTFTTVLFYETVRIVLDLRALGKKTATTVRTTS
jgi:hypothetical protein